ncbi:MAG: hypothetical protein U9R08_06660 [Nanoarchaeota archaeon]|nr:hypothetical protein [Nanoarchaeota archaeon]
MRDVSKTQIMDISGSDDSIDQFFIGLQPQAKNLVIGDLEVFAQALYNEVEYTKDPVASYKKLEDYSISTFNILERDVLENVKPDERNIQKSQLYLGLIEAFRRKHTFSYDPFMVASAYLGLAKLSLARDLDKNAHNAKVDPRIHQTSLKELKTEIMPLLWGGESNIETMKSAVIKYSMFKASHTSFAQTNLAHALNNYVEALDVLTKVTRIGGEDSWKLTGYDFWKHLPEHLSESKLFRTLKADFGMIKIKVDTYAKSE